MMRILHVVTDMNRGGLETMIMNYYRHMDRSEIQFDFLTHRGYKGDYGDEIENMGGVIHHLPRLNPFSVKYKNALRDFFREHGEYSVVHVHQDCMSSVILRAAEEEDVPVRIAHSHNADQDKNLKYPVKMFYRGRIPCYATHLMACGRKAGDWMFRGQEYSVITNAIETDRYTHHDDVRRKTIRETLGIGDEDFLIGHIGRFAEQKNHSFIIDVFEELNRLKPAKLLLIGDGRLKRRIEKKVEDLKLSDRVIFAGIREDVPDMLMAMDAFLFPSLYEGLPMTLIEAQASGLNCYISDAVSSEAVIEGKPEMDTPVSGVYRIPLSCAADIWAMKIAETVPIIREDRAEDIKRSGYDIVDNAKKLQEFYLAVCE